MMRSFFCPSSLLRRWRGHRRVTTSQYDNARTGANLNETKLTPRNVNVQHFGKIFTLHVDGDIYAQPLFLGGVGNLPGKAATMCSLSPPSTTVCMPSMLTGHPSTPLWKASFLKGGLTTVPAQDAEIVHSSHRRSALRRPR